MTRLNSLTFSLIGTLTLVGCASTSTVTDELAGETSADDAVTGAGKADSAVDGAYTYYTITRDMRRCAAPGCGGYFFARVNRTTTTCVDGSSQGRCYAPELDWSESGLGVDAQDRVVSAASRAAANTFGVVGLVRGRFAKSNSTPKPSLGRFIVTEAWIADGTGIADGVFARVKDAGVRCIAAPCPSLKETGLNTSRFAMIAGVDYAEAGLTDAQLEAATNALFEPSGIIVAGDRYTIRENGRTAKGRTATQVFRRVADAPGACFVGGCSNQVCSDREGVITTCEYDPTYACYATATCERQPDGACGWTSTPELDACLAGN